MSAIGIGISNCFVQFVNYFNRIINDGYTVAWYKPTEAANVTAVAGVESIWWDMMYGKLGALGAEQDAGNIIKYAVYKITATQVNYFYAGCAVGDIFVCNTVVACTVNNKVQRYTGNHLTQPVNTNRPTNQIFDGVDNFMKTAPIVFNQPAIVYAVIRQLTWVNANYIWDGGSVAGDTMDFFQNGVTPKYIIYAGVMTPNMEGQPLNVYEIVRAIYNGANSEFKSDNFTLFTGDVGNAAPAGFTLGNVSPGGAAYANFQVKEIIIRNFSDNISQQNIIMNNLRNKWGLYRTYTLKRLSDCPIATNQAAFAVCNGLIYYTGGTQKQMWCYNPITNIWVRKADCIFPGLDRQSAIFRTVGNNIYFIGGMESATSIMKTEVYEYNTLTDIWTQKTSMTTEREDFGSAVSGTKIYCFGGLRTGALPTNVLQIYDAATDTWDDTKLALPVNKWSGDFGCFCNGKIYAIGSAAVYAGYPVLTPVLTIYEYDIAANTWTAKTPMPLGICYKNCIPIGNKIYILGGQGAGDYSAPGTKTSNCYAFDTVTNLWERIDNVPYAALGYAATIINDEVYIGGGMLDDGSSTNVFYKMKFY